MQETGNSQKKLVQIFPMFVNTSKRTVAASVKDTLTLIRLLHNSNIGSYAIIISRFSINHCFTGQCINLIFFWTMYKIHVWPRLINQLTKLFLPVPLSSESFKFDFIQYNLDIY